MHEEEPTEFYISKDDLRMSPYSNGMEHVTCKAKDGTYDCDFPISRYNREWNKKGNHMSGISRVKCDDPPGCLFTFKDGNTFRFNSRHDMVCKKDKAWDETWLMCGPFEEGDPPKEEP